ncbi:MAG: alkaline phosphatase [Candidatus Heimdallarchaeota archaeon]|nr:alkaline phosphatase [Candidatus Heimdallarchaeota archaeon]
MKKLEQFVFILLLIVGLSTSSSNIISHQETGIQILGSMENEMPNVIYLIGDGMGPEAVKLASLVEYGDPNATIMDTDFPWQTTYTHDEINGDITDSAASGTALATGQLTMRGIVGMDKNADVKYKNILEYLSQDFNYATGLITTLGITHATPATFGSHIRNREIKDDILEQELNNNITVLMGGDLGTSVMGDASNVAALGEQYNYDTATTPQELQAIRDTASRVLGVFPGLGYESERDVDTTPSLYDMSEVALEVLDRNNKPFFVMIEGGNIDYAGHLGNYDTTKTGKSATETIMFEKVARLALDYAINDGNTIVIVAADHETGGLTVNNWDDLNSTLPDESNTRDQNNALRIDRANMIDVTWEGTVHTRTPVPFYGYGFTKQIDININADVFWAIVNELGAFPVVQRVTYAAAEENVTATVNIKDLDSTVENVTLVVEYQAIERIDRQSVELSNFDTTGTVSIFMETVPNEMYNVYVILEDGIDPVLDTTSLKSEKEVNIVLTTESTTTEIETTPSSNVEETPVKFMIFLPFLGILVYRLTKSVKTP